MPSNDDYVSLTIKRQALLERVKSGQVKNYVSELKALEELAKVSILMLDDEVGDLSRTKLNALLAQLRTDQGAVFQAATAAFLKDAAKIAAISASGEALAIESTVDLRGTKLKAFTQRELFKTVLQRPMTTAGDLLEPWLKKFSETEINRVNGAIRAGWSQGKTNQELVRQIVGTKARGYNDGILATTRRNAETVVRTSVQHAASAARQELWEANTDVVKGYRWVSTLDSVTSKLCRSLDGQKFELGKGPTPPIHPRCRSTTIAVLDPKFDFLDKGATRSSAEGPVSAETSYYDWLKRQDEKTQVQVLGKKRAKLFRQGGLSAERFRALQFDKNFEPLTLDEMAAIEPEAFKRAGI